MTDLVVNHNFLLQIYDSAMIVATKANTNVVDVLIFLNPNFSAVTSAHPITTACVEGRARTEVYLQCIFALEFKHGDRSYTTTELRRQF